MGRAGEPEHVSELEKAQTPCSKLHLRPNAKPKTDVLRGDAEVTSEALEVLEEVL